MRLYFRSDVASVNGLTGYLLDTTNTATYTYVSVAGYTQIGIRVWRRNVNGNEYEITGGTPVSIVSVPTTSGSASASWLCPRVILSSGDSIVVRVYGYDGTNWVLLATFTTLQLNYLALVSSQWTITYYFYIKGATKQFRWGDSTYPSNINNIGFELSESVSTVLSDPIGDSTLSVYTANTESIASPASDSVGDSTISISAINIEPITVPASDSIGDSSLSVRTSTSLSLTVIPL